MPKYVRTSNRGNWTQEQLSNALNAIKNENMSVYKAAIAFCIPRKTLERRLKKNNPIKGHLGPGCTFGYENERRLSRHIQKMQSMGFPLTRSDLRTIVFKFAQQLNVKHKFNTEKQKAGYDFVSGFLNRNQDIKIRKSEGISIARLKGMNRNETESYFNLLETVLKENELFAKPSNIFNMDETGLQLNNRPGAVLAKKGSKAVATITSTEKGETVTVIACCSAEGIFLPPACIMKGKNKKAEFEDGLPPGSVLYMSQKSAYITAEIFTAWLKDHFIPRKPTGKVLLIVDGHASHCSIEVLELAEANDIIFLCLPSHTTHYLQPLDRAFFKSLKTYFYEHCRNWLNNHPGRRITRSQFGTLLSESWGKSATQRNGSSGFSATGIHPFNPSIIPEYAFISEVLIEDEVQNKRPVDPNINGSKSPQPETSKSVSNTIESPSKFLDALTPILEIDNFTRKRAKQVAAVLTSKESIKSKKDKLEKKLKIQNRKPRLFKRKSESIYEDEEDIILLDSEDTAGEDCEYDCIRCGENYYKTEKIEDWIQCVICRKWMHENCTPFDNTCDTCGKKAKKKNKGKENEGKGKGKGKRTKK